MAPTRAEGILPAAFTIALATIRAPAPILWMPAARPSGIAVRFGVPVGVTALGAHPVVLARPTEPSAAARTDN